MNGLTRVRRHPTTRETIKLSRFEPPTEKSSPHFSGSNDSPKHQLSKEIALRTLKKFRSNENFRFFRWPESRKESFEDWFLTVSRNSEVLWQTFIGPTIGRIFSKRFFFFCCNFWGSADTPHWTSPPKNSEKGGVREWEREGGREREEDCSSVRMTSSMHERQFRGLS